MQNFPYSHSQMEKADFCPRAYRYSYETDIKPLKDPVFFAAGHAMEAGVDKVLEMVLAPGDYDVEQMAEEATTALRAKFYAEALVRDKKTKELLPSPSIDWKGKSPREILAPLENLVSQFADIGAGDDGYIRAVHNTQLRLLAKIDGTPGFRFIPDYLCEILPARRCEACAEACAIQRGKALKKWEQPPCGVCYGTEQVPDHEARPVFAILDLKTAATHWDDIACQAATQPKRYLWALRKANPKLAARVTHAGFLIGAKTKRGGWQLLLSQATEFDMDEADDAFWVHHDLVESGRRPMRPGYAGKNCSWCDYKLACHRPAEAWKELRGPGISKPKDAAQGLIDSI